MILVLIYMLLILGCASTEHKRELLQSQHPDCFVEKDLIIVCPDPFKDPEKLIRYLDRKQKEKDGYSW